LSFNLQNAAKDGVVMATEKKLPPLMDESTVQKISLVTDNIGVVYAGMGPDSRVLVRKARKIAQQYYRMYHVSMPVNQLVREVAAIMQEFTQSGFVIVTYHPPFQQLESYHQLLLPSNNVCCAAVYDPLACRCSSPDMMKWLDRSFTR